ncbi:BTB/POZ protein [Pelagophyceae sp. CCMP2097]|nr:BTB/POZ protein [Pelagophyceae sp. CCMP2097]
MDAERVWRDLDNHERALRKEAFQLREIWHKTTELHAANAKDRAAFEKEAQLDFVDATARVTLNVGGQLFETTCAVLTARDRFSVLAALCLREPALAKQADGTFFLDRDWWLFRHVLQFLRTGALPQDVALLRELYDEANFYRLESLRAAIRQVPGPQEPRWATNAR